VNWRKVVYSLDLKIGLPQSKCKTQRVGASADHQSFVEFTVYNPPEPQSLAGFVRVEQLPICESCRVAPGSGLWYLGLGVALAVLFFGLWAQGTDGTFPSILSRRVAHPKGFWVGGAPFDLIIAILCRE
jgi:hypothetical protein